MYNVGSTRYYTTYAKLRIQLRKHPEVTFPTRSLSMHTDHVYTHADVRHSSHQLLCCPLIQMWNDVSIISTIVRYGELTKKKERYSRCVDRKIQITGRLGEGKGKGKGRGEREREREREEIHREREKVQSKF